MDSSQFKHILLPLSSKMYRTAFRLVNNNDIAKDIVQETYITLWNMRDSLSHIKDIEQFVIRIVRNKSIDTLRTNHTCQLDVNNITINNYYSSVECLYEDNERLNSVMMKISLLPTLQKQILLMRSVQDLSFDEIEQATGLSNANIRSLLSRARKKLRELCQSELND